MDSRFSVFMAQPGGNTHDFVAEIGGTIVAQIQ
jgi:hypothetical protein